MGDCRAWAHGRAVAFVWTLAVVGCTDERPDFGASRDERQDARPASASGTPDSQEKITDAGEPGEPSTDLPAHRPSLDAGESPSVLDTRSRSDEGPAMGSDADDGPESTTDEVAAGTGHADGEVKTSGLGTLNEPCDRPGLLACAGAAQDQLLICRRGSWASNGVCGLGENCDRQIGRCVAVATGCQVRRPGESFCKGDVRMVCDPDLTSLSDEPCVGRCVETSIGAACALPECGDGKVQPPEQCDDANDVDTDECTSLCQHARCGDGFVGPGEHCDDGNADDTDGCTSNCTLPPCSSAVDAGECDDGPPLEPVCTSECGVPQCGDGQVDLGEECDDGNSFDGDACTASCRLAKCGDGILGPGEACDDGNTINDDGCTDTCAISGCGDGLVGSSEECDDGNTDSTDECTNACKWAVCGDGVVGPAEECDDGNLSNDDECTTACTTSTCGDGIVSLEEECDDGNTINDDFCTVSCLVAKCGDGIVGPGEECDDGNTTNTDSCTGACVAARCGDGIVGPAEQCDDGNSIDTDACTATCMTAKCGDGVVGPGEECDDGNTDNQDGCTAGCLLPVCGDGYVGPGEQCDDGNSRAGDGCSMACEVEHLAASVATGSQHGCAVLDDATLKCWGQGSFGKLGLGDTNSRGDGPNEMGDNLPRVSLGTGRSVIEVSAGTSHTCARLNDGSVKCWGANANGRLGLGNTVHRGDEAGEMGDGLPTVQLGAGRTAKRVSAGGLLTCVVLDDNTVKCWGAGSNGCLGKGNVDDLGDGPNEMGDDLTPVNLGVGRAAAEVGVGNSHACARFTDGAVKCWGANSYGQLGLGNTDNRGDAPNEMGDALPPVDLGTGRTAKALGIGANHSCAVLDNGEVKCWGRNSVGQLGQENTDDHGDEAGEMGVQLPAIKLGSGRTAIAVSAGLGHTCALLDDATVKCWGFNNGGQLGQGHTASLGTGSNQLGDNLAAVELGAGRSALMVWTGDYHSCVLLDNGAVKCWGLNSGGQLGQGDNTERGTSAGQMGDALLPIDFGAQ